MASLKDKVILITGAGDESGIGAATALHMIQFGPRFVLTGRRQEKLDIVGKLMEDAGVCKDRLLLVVADVTIDADQERLVKSAIDKFQQLDVVIHNAGITAYHKTMDTSMEEFDLVMRTNLRAPFYLSKLCLPYLIKTKGNIVNVSSISGQRTFTAEAPYGISKAGLDHFTRILAMEMAEHGVRVNSVNPGVIRTNIQQKGGMSSQQYVEYIERQKLKHPLGNIGEPIDVAKAITFLSSEDSSFITGELIFVDGGRHSHPV
ncbi:estradiol 17-beta-dehydrogenase 8-like [Mercenaria mercenaria]|uniref:estradiol 17-beta-dehydrogenase 8-like n=1 Tax=Mercenaria mercenaria TaxID=6596 RepID=UPI00234EFFF8|nr:estradiol 17-beta-dehydrogenase 8-like [Mercenaria mercenaria]